MSLKQPITSLMRLANIPKSYSGMNARCIVLREANLVTGYSSLPNDKHNYKGAKISTLTIITLIKSMFDMNSGTKAKTLNYKIPSAWNYVRCR